MITLNLLICTSLWLQVVPNKEITASVKGSSFSFNVSPVLLYVTMAGQLTW